MDIQFKTRKLESVFNSELRLERQYGDRMARVIMVRLAVLRGAHHLGLVPAAKPARRHQLTGGRKNQFAVDLIYPNRLIFRPDHNPIPRKDDGGIDLEAVTAIEIVEVIDYH